MSVPQPARKGSHKLTLVEVLEALVKESFLDVFTAKKLLQEHGKKAVHPMEILGECQIKDHRHYGRPMSIDKLVEWYATVCKMPYLRIDPLKMNMDKLVNLIPHAYATRLNILPVEVKEKSVVIATSEPFQAEWTHEISSVLRKDIELRLASPVQIKLILEELYVVQKAVRKMGAQALGGKSPEQQKLIRQGKLEELDNLIEQGRQKNWGDSDSSVVKIVDWLINYANSERASDIHLEPKKGRAQIRFRVDGVLNVVYKMDPDSMLNVVSRLKILAEMKVDEKRKPQDGRIKRFMDNGTKVEMRVSVIPCYYGEKMVMRIFDQKVEGKDLDFIGFAPEDAKKWDQLIHSPQGLILVTGPTGSGKTTTLYTSLNIVSSPDVNVCTVEDPIEMTVESFNQMQVNNSIGLHFSEAIRAFLRQDPDVIMVGEIRDHETGEAAIQASLTGHLVFSTLHTNGALATIQRMLDLGLPSFLINSSLKAILAQRLVRRLCPECKVKVEPTDAEWADVVDDLDLEKPDHIYKSAGCSECKYSGYRGRLCVYELVEIKDELKKIIHQKVEMVELKEKSKGMFVPFRYNCLRKVIEGETTLEEVLTVMY